MFTGFSFLWSFLIRLGLEVLSPVLFGGDLIPMSPGPYWFIFSVLPMYFREIPRVHGRGNGHRTPLSFSEKSLIYLLFIQLALSSKYSSLFPSLVGVLGGLVYYGLFLMSKFGRDLRIPTRVMRGFMNSVNFGDNSSARSLQRSVLRKSFGPRPLCLFWSC